MFLGKANRPLQMLDAVLEKFFGSRGSVNGYQPTTMMYKCTAAAHTSADFPSYTFGAFSTSCIAHRCDLKGRARRDPCREQHPREREWHRFASIWTQDLSRISLACLCGKGKHVAGRYAALERQDCTTSAAVAATVS